MRYSILFLVVFMTACSGARTANYTKHISENPRFEDQHGVVLSFDGDNLEFHGYPDFNKQNESGSMMYPGGTPELFFVAVLTHAAIQGSANDNRIEAIQAEADQVLAPYMNAINAISAQEMMAEVVVDLDQRWPGVNVVKSGPPRGEKQWILTLEPVFYIMQDQKSILLRNVVKLAALNDREHVVYQNLVEVLSEELQTDNPQDHWIREQSGVLTNTTKELITYSIELAAKDIRKEFVSEERKQKTYSFMQGGSKTYQRGNLLMSECKRSTIRTLRGWIKSFPQQSNHASCESELPKSDLAA